MLTTIIKMELSSDVVIIINIVIVNRFFFDHIVASSLAGILFIQDPRELWQYTNSSQYSRVTSSFQPCQTLSIWH